MGPTSRKAPAGTSEIGNRGITGRHPEPAHRLPLDDLFDQDRDGAGLLECGREGSPAAAVIAKD
jgi:hypothetical protein